MVSRLSEALLKYFFGQWLLFYFLFFASNTVFQMIYDAINHITYFPLSWQYIKK